MTTILAIAQSTFKETMRRRILWILLVFGIIVIATSQMFSYLSVGEEFKFIVDIGLGSILFFGLLIAAVQGAFMIPADIEGRIVFTILSKPVRRIEFILGKYLGIVATLLVNVVLMGIAFLIVYYFKKVPHSIDPNAIKAIILIFFELCVLTAIAVAASTVATPAFTIILTFFVYFVGCMGETLAYIGERAELFLTRLGVSILATLVPRFENFDVRQKMLLDEPVAWIYMGKVMGFGLLYIAFMMLVAYLLFNEREF